MTDPLPLTITDDWAEALFAGAPMAEMVLAAFIGTCQHCGCAAEEQFEGSLLLNAFVTEDGTLYGDTFCLGCHDEDSDEPVVTLPPIPQLEAPEDPTDT